MTIWSPIIRRVTDDDLVFKALADPTRRHLLDRLFERDGRTLTELESELEMTRFGVMKHLRVLEDAGLVVTRRQGREKLHFLNPVPIRLIHDRWIDKYAERQVVGALRAQDTTGGTSMTTTDAQTTQVYQVFIKASAEEIWEAITRPEWTRALLPRRADRRSRRTHYDSRSADGDVWGDSRSRFDPPRKLVHGWRSMYDPELAAEEESRVTWEIEPRTRRRLPPHRHPRPARGRAEDGGQRLGTRLDRVISALKTLLETGKSLYEQLDRSTSAVETALQLATDSCDGHATFVA